MPGDEHCSRPPPDLAIWGCGVCLFGLSVCLVCWLVGLFVMFCLFVFFSFLGSCFLGFDFLCLFLPFWFFFLFGVCRCVCVCVFVKWQGLRNPK